MGEPFGPTSERAELLSQIDDMSARLAQMGQELRWAEERIRQAVEICFDDMTSDRAGWQVAYSVRIALLNEGWS